MIPHEPSSDLSESEEDEPPPPRPTNWPNLRVIKKHEEEELARLEYDSPGQQWPMPLPKRLSYIHEDTNKMVLTARLMNLSRRFIIGPLGDCRHRPGGTVYTATSNHHSDSPLTQDARLLVQYSAKSARLECRSTARRNEAFRRHAEVKSHTNKTFTTDDVTRHLYKGTLSAITISALAISRNSVTHPGCNF